MALVPRTPRKKNTRPRHRREGDTAKKNRFYQAIDTRGRNPILLVYFSQQIPLRTGEYWLHQRRELGEDVALKRIGTLRTGRPPKLLDETLNTLLDP